MPLLDVGKNELAALICGTGIPFDAAHAKLSVGDGTLPFNAAQTDLVGGSTFSKAVTSGFPQLAGNVIMFQANYTTAEANFPWQEWGVSNGSILLNRKVEALGTKANTQAWQLTVTLTVTNP